MTARMDFETANNATWGAGPVLLRDTNDAALAMPGGVKIQMQLRSPAASDDIALDLSLDNGRLAFVGQPDAATIAIDVPVVAMRDVRAGAYEHDIVVTYPSGRVIRAVAGVVTVAQGVTR